MGQNNLDYILFYNVLIISQVCYAGFRVTNQIYDWHVIIMYNLLFSMAASLTGRM